MMNAFQQDVYHLTVKELLQPQTFPAHGFLQTDMTSAFQRKHIFILTHKR